jgi:AraC family transcriptional activator of pobA
MRNIPVYQLYGEHEHWPTPDLLHCETIAARSELHNWEIKPHQHHGLFQLLDLRSGAATIRVDDQTSQMQAGQVLSVPPMCIHGFAFAPHSEGHVFTLAYPLLHKHGQAAVSAVLARPQVHRLGDDDDSACARMAFDTLAREYRRIAPHREVLMDSLLSLILVWLARNSTRSAQEAQPAVSRAEEHFAHFCRLIEDEYTKHHTVTHYAGQIGLSAAHLNVLCRRAAGRSALELIHQRLLLEAKRNLVYTSMTVNVVSYALGFADPAYFTRFFKRATGLAPKDFRNQTKAALGQQADLSLNPAR